MIERSHVGADRAHARYSAAGEITVANVDEPEIVRRWAPDEGPLEEYGTRPGRHRIGKSFAWLVRHASPAEGRTPGLPTSSQAGRERS